MLADALDLPLDDLFRAYERVAGRERSTSISAGNASG